MQQRLWAEATNSRTLSKGAGSYVDDVDDEKGASGYVDDVDDDDIGDVDDDEEGASP